MSGKLNLPVNEIEAPRSEDKTTEQVERRPSLSEVVVRVREDSRRDAEQYLRETEVPFGGE